MFYYELGSVFKYHSSFVFNYRQDGIRYTPEDRIVYHYTSPEGFLGILSGQSLRFTDISYMNDRSEGIYFVKVLLDFLAKNQGKFPLCEDVINNLLDKNSFDDIKRLNITKIKYNGNWSNSRRPVRSFVFCTCSDADSLNMWNYYVKNGTYQGYNIGIKVESFLEYIGRLLPEKDTTSLYYGKVLYNLKKQEEEIEYLLTKMEEVMEDSIKDLSNIQNIMMWYLRHYIELYGVFYKHPKFEGEKEYRFVIEAEEKDGYNLPFDSKEIGGMKKSIREDFCVKNGIIAPYLTVPFGNDTISRVYISPMTEFDIAKRSIKELTYRKDYRVFSIYQSKIPIRY